MSEQAVQIARSFASKVRQSLAAGADPVRAAGQRSYMKSALPYYGLSTPQVRAVVRSVLAGHPIPDRTTWLAVVRELWDGATHREERYAALGVLRSRTHRGWLTRDDALLELIRHLITSGAWWDLVDETSHIVGDLLRIDPATMTPLLRGWSREPDLWLRRASIIAQLGFRERTDLGLLAYVIDGSLDDPDFFARKAIGWALREYAKTDPQWVREFVRANEGRLSGLSKREALRHLGE